ncbi:dihydroxy-acid dehydratase [Roseivivax sp. CAU 1761]
MRRALASAVLLALVLAGCATGPDGRARAFLDGFTTPGSEGGASALAKPDSDLPPIRRAALAGGEVVVAGPDGYCIDPVTLKGTAREGVVILASCRILSGGRTGPEVAPALITVTVGAREPAPVLPDPPTLAGIAGAPLASGETRGGFSLAQISEGGGRFFEGSDGRYWRGAFVLRSRLVALALYAPAGSPLAAGRRGAELLDQVQRAIRAASPGAPLSGRPAGTSRG